MCPQVAHWTVQRCSVFKASLLLIVHQTQYTLTMVQSVDVALVVFVLKVLVAALKQIIQLLFYY